MVSSWYIHVCYSCPTIFLKELNGILVSFSPVWFYLCSQLRNKVKLGWGNKDTEDYLLHSRSFLNPALRIPHGISNSEHHWHCIVHHPAKFVNIYIIYTIVMVIIFNIMIIQGVPKNCALAFLLISPLHLHIWRSPRTVWKSTGQVKDTRGHY